MTLRMDPRSKGPQKQLVSSLFFKKVKILMIIMCVKKVEESKYSLIQLLKVLEGIFNYFKNSTQLPPSSYSH